ncbi:MAG: hypothetical protein QXF35_00050 [Candidatus Bilamarchaeaceae archaeon]
MADKKKKVVDKWKTKRWYTILAPAAFEFKPIGEVVSSDESNLINRVVRVSLFELGLSNPSSQIAMFTNLSFRITSVSDSNVNTKLIGHEIAPSFIKTFARRGKSLIHQVVDIKTKDNESVRLKLIAVTQSKVSENTRRNIRNALVDDVKKAASDKTFDELMQDVVYGRFSARLFNRLKQITEMKRVEVRKSERAEEFK